MSIEEKIILSAFGLLLILVAISVAYAWRKHQAERRRQAVTLRRLRSIGDLPGEITQGYVAGRGKHDAENTHGIPVQAVLGKVLRERPGGHRGPGA